MWAAAFDRANGRRHLHRGDREWRNILPDAGIAFSDPALGRPRRCRLVLAAILETIRAPFAGRTVSIEPRFQAGWISPPPSSMAPAACRRCGLGRFRVIRWWSAAGNPVPGLMVDRRGHPGARKDVSGRPFVGRSGPAARSDAGEACRIGHPIVMGLTISNVVMKCRPRRPKAEPAEMAALPCLAA